MKVAFSIDAKQVEDEDLTELVLAALYKAAIRLAEIEFERSYQGHQQETPKGLLSSDSNL
jgi:hypothetical protein